jgi:hypothetical protein
MKMLTEEKLRELLGKAYMRWRKDQNNHIVAEIERGVEGAKKVMHNQMDAEAAQVERIIAGL